MSCVAVHQHLGLDDRDDALLLAERRVARQRVGVRLDAVGASGCPSPIVITARHLAKRAPRLVYSSQPLAQAVEALGDHLARRAAPAPWRRCRP